MMLLITLLVMSCTSCARWREAKGVIAEADSLLVHKIVTRDTAALNFVIRAFEGPIGYVFARNNLAEAYYLMGRNVDDCYLNYAEEAEYYIVTDRG
jgi:hypothetical protein